MRNIKLITFFPVIIALSVVLIPSCKKPPDVPEITVEQLKQQVDSGALVAIIDLRTQDEYNADHIKGALSMPYVNIISGRWQPPKNTDWIFALYCQ